ncbi:MAG TPA: DUF3536 domain-containing protein [Pseudomonadota bacterium]|nr:DUF3536 domain-containing protein [Pseudomonadota bacterium]
MRDTPPRYVCIHGHFYQPPRENPWLETVEVQPGAAPYHDWNRRITAECYAANAQARLLDERGLIARILRTYDRISFNIGPTLLSWLEEQAPRVYQAILAADAESQRRFSGHGSAMAQVYNHVIMPLANRRDQVTQVRWGLRDFKRRFGRAPEGMWLPETAVDLQTLSVLAEHDIRYTVLAPHQAKLPPGTSLDPTRPYRVALPGGRSIAVFFYDGPVSRAVAFEHLLGSGERFLARLLSAFPGEGGPGAAQLVHIATDGETYGHHHKFGEMALAYVIDRLERVLPRSDGLGAGKNASPAATGTAPLLTNYGEFLSRHPPQQSIEIVENSAWSCAHGIERWRSDCGCNSGGNPGFHQRWRAPLRAALDALRDAITPLYVEQATPLLRDPWAARDDYVDVVNDRSERSRSRFLRSHATRSLSEGEQVTVWHLLEMQRHSQLMYTSCGWFFDDIAGPEPTQIVQYAGRVVQLAGALGQAQLGELLRTRLAQVPGNTAAVPDGRTLYDRCVGQVAIDMQHSQIAASYVLSQIVGMPPSESESRRTTEAEEAKTRLFCYEITPRTHARYRSGSLCLSRGTLRVSSLVTTAGHELSYVALHFGAAQVAIGISENLAPNPAQSPLANDETGKETDELARALDAADIPALLRTLSDRFGARLYSLGDLPLDSQRAAWEALLAESLRPLTQSLNQLSALHAPLFQEAARDALGVTIPRELQLARELSLSHELGHALRQPRLHRPFIAALLKRAHDEQVGLDLPALRRQLSTTLKARLEDCEDHAESESALTELVSVVELAVQPPFSLDLIETQDLCYALRHELYASQRSRGATGWLQSFTRLAELCRIAL